MIYEGTVKLCYHDTFEQGRCNRSDVLNGVALKLKFDGYI